MNETFDQLLIIYAFMKRSRKVVNLWFYPFFRRTNSSDVLPSKDVFVSFLKWTSICPPFTTYYFATTTVIEK